VRILSRCVALLLGLPACQFNPFAQTNPAGVAGGGTVTPPGTGLQVVTIDNASIASLRAAVELFDPSAEIHVDFPPQGSCNTARKSSCLTGFDFASVSFHQNLVTALGILGNPITSINGFEFDVINPAGVELDAANQDLFADLKPFVPGGAGAPFILGMKLATPQSPGLTQGEAPLQVTRVTNHWRLAPDLDQSGQRIPLGDYAGIWIPIEIDFSGASAAAPFVDTNVCRCDGDPTNDDMPQCADLCQGVNTRWLGADFCEQVTVTTRLNRVYLYLGFVPRRMDPIADQAEWDWTKYLFMGAKRLFLHRVGIAVDVVVVADSQFQNAFGNHNDNATAAANDATSGVAVAVETSGCICDAFICERGISPFRSERPGSLIGMTFRR
jgi:hypothetical protein